MDRYREMYLPGGFDPLAVIATVVGSGLLTDYLVYERDGCWYLGGNPAGEVTVHEHVVRSSFGGGSAEPWSGTPWRAVRTALHSSPFERWNAYGWACFELVAPTGRSDTLAHLMIPTIELRVTHNGLLIRASGNGPLRAIRGVIDEVHPVADAKPTPVDVRLPDTGYLRAVATAVEQIQRGRLQKVILSRSVDVPFDVDVPATYLVGRQANTPARSFLVQLGGWQAAGFSPETIVEVGASGTVSTNPLAGTRARTGDPATDGRLRAELQSDPKEVFEHATSVKLAFEELTTVGRDGSTMVSEFLAVKARGSVQHLGSRVDTMLAEQCTEWDALAAVFPAITASGIPKASATKLITDLETEPRGLYAGAVLMAGSDGALDAALVLRAVYRRAGRVWLRAGAGVVGMSRPEREYEETCEKLGSVAPYLVAADPVPELTRIAAAERTP